MAQLIAVRYAAALFEIAREKDIIDKFDEQCAMLLTLFENDKEFRSVINHPSITNSQKSEIVENSLKGIIADDIIGLMNLMFQKHREDMLEEVFTEFKSLVLKHKNVAIATVYSAVHLSDDRAEKIRRELEEKLKKQVEIRHILDKSLIGGIKILVDGIVIDTSIQSRINLLKRQLMNTQLK